VGYVSRIFFKWLVALTLAGCVGLLVAFNALLLWVATGPRSLDELTPYLQATFEPADNSYSVGIGQTWLIWDGWKHPIDIQLRDVDVKLKGGTHFTSFPEMSIGLDALSLLFGQFLPTSLTLTHPVMNLVQNEDHSISLGFRDEAQAEEAPAVPLSVVLAPLVTPENSGSMRKLRLINIRNADVTVGSAKKGTFFKASGASIFFKRNRQGVVQASSSATIAYGAYQSKIRTHFSYSKQSAVIEGDASVENLMPGALAAMFSDNPVLAGMQFPMSGNAKMAMDAEGNLQKLDFIVDGGEGNFVSDKLHAPLPINTLHVEGQLRDNAVQLEIRKLNANLDGVLLGGDGVWMRKDDDNAIRANVQLKHVPAKKLEMLWPPSLSPMSREWVVANITEGMVTDAQSHFNIAFGDLAKPVLPKESVDARFMLDGAKIRYLPEHPALNNVKGVIHVDGVSMDADIESGDFLKDTHLSGGKLLIEDLNADNPYIKVDFDTASNTADIVHFLGLPRLGHAARLNLKEEGGGTVKGHASVGFYFFAKHDANGKPLDAEIDYSVTGEMKDVGQPDFMKKFEIKNSSGTLAIDNKSLEFKGSGTVNGANVSQAEVKYLFAPEQGFDTFIDATATAPVESLPRFGYPAWPFLKGAFAVNAKVKLGAAKEHSEATIDLTDTAIRMTNIGFFKDEKIPATLELTADKKDNVANIPSFRLKGKDMAAKGSAELDKGMSDFSRISMENIRYGDTDLDQLLYQQIEGGFLLEASGKSADIGPWVGRYDAPQQEGTFSFDHFPAVRIKGKVDRLVFDKDRQLLGVKGELTCDVERCTSADITGSTGEAKTFTAHLGRNAKGVRQFTLQAQNAGAFLKSANLFDGMEGGNLALTGSFNDSGAFVGRLDIGEHTIKDASVLAKILSLASLTGFFDTLQGKGIHFERLRAPFTLVRDVVTIDKAKTYGPAMGMTLEGTITFPKRVFDLEGTIVPSYSLNTVLGKVPLVGYVLTGGEGQGVFAASYKIKGVGKEPDISVNPLSMLTPGFLRGLFDILDKPRKTEEEE